MRGPASTPQVEPCTSRPPTSTRSRTDAALRSSRASEDAARAADDEQDQKRATAPLATKARNAASKSVEEAVKRISAAGALQFAHDKSKRARFEELLSTTSAKKSAKPAAPIR